METITQLIQAVQTRAWYAVAALALTLLIALWRMWQPKVWDKIPERLQWLPAVLLAAAGAFVAAWETGATWLEALVVAIYSALTTGTSAIGWAHTGKRLLGKGGAAAAPAGDGATAGPA